MRHWIVATWLLSLTLASGASAAADALVPMAASGLTLKVPAVWKKTSQPPTYRFVAPSEDASFELTAMPVDPKRKAFECVDQLMAALGPGWDRTRAGSHPAARRSTVERADGVEVETLSFVGCNGSTKWVLTWTYTLAKQARFSAVAQKVFDSIRYGK